MLTGVRALAALMLGLSLTAATLAADATPAAPAAAGAAAGEAATEAANPEPQPYKGTGVVLINPENADEAMLLVQIMVPGSDGKSAPQVVGLPLNKDATSAKLVKEFGVKAVKPGDEEGSKKAQAEAKQKFVQVDGVLNFDDKGPTLTVKSYEKVANVPVKDEEPAAAPAK